jgi:hypothetical protein
MRYSAEQRIFIQNTFLKRKSWRKCRRSFHRKFPESAVPFKARIYRITVKFRATESVSDKKKQEIRTRRVPTEGFVEVTKLAEEQAHLYFKKSNLLS